MAAAKNDNFEKYLSSHYIDKAEGETSTNLRFPNKEKNKGGGNYHIPSDEFSDFIKKYYQHIFVEGNEDHLDRSWQPRPQVQMLINGVALLIEEARQRRRTPAATPTPSVPPSAQPPVQQPTTQLRPLVGPMPAEEATNAAAGEPALSAAEVDKLRALEPVLRRLLDTRSFDDACTASRLELAQHLPPTKLPMQSCRALASCALCSSRTHLERMISSLACRQAFC